MNTEDNNIELAARIERIKSSIDRINHLMAELRTGIPRSNNDTQKVEGRYIQAKETGPTNISSTKFRLIRGGKQDT